MKFNAVATLTLSWSSN